MRLNCSKFLFVFIFSAFLFASCSTSPIASNSSPTSTATQTSSELSTETGTETVNSEATPVSDNLSASIPGFKELPRLEGKATVVMTVKGLPITIEVDGTNAPISAGNFVDLVQRGAYNGLMFHRVERDPSPFVVQGGDPQSKDPKVPATDLGTGSFIDPKTNKIRYIPLEIKPLGSDKPLYSKTFKDAAVSQQPVLRHKRGAVAMARSQMPDSASSQFYFALSDLPPLDGSYAVFGYVREGMDVVDKIQQGDRIDSAKVTQGAENLK
ncbi:peptidylprolyl isomerase [Scytonema sp. UIC 10036]|uniref:peptidylprolyl isomerase n=1 Tax=Scytonema sp. UIC 10036 TaxID=2304196 RepID=UPI0012DA4969|nr:peptidylprolyl isomerase [Scytonema sp. UIC 10036]MUG94472.1 peptidylprolyl isomerase [Scytonema sp. UIC 10036]